MSRILVVDDSAIARRNLMTILTKAGHNIVSEADNGMQGYREYTMHKPDLVTMDITMPIMDGVAAVQKIVGDFPDAKIIVISAIDQKPMVMKAVAAGAKHYILKPFLPEKVIAAVNLVLGNMPGRAQAAASYNTGFGSVASVQDTEPFRIENRNGAFIVNISQYFVSDHLPILVSKTNPLLESKPLRMIFDFGNIEIKDSSLGSRLAQLICAVRDAGGLVLAKTSDQRFANYLASQGIDVN